MPQVPKFNLFLSPFPTPPPFFAGLRPLQLLPRPRQAPVPRARLPDGPHPRQRVRVQGVRGAGVPGTPARGRPRVRGPALQGGRRRSCQAPGHRCHVQDIPGGVEAERVGQGGVAAARGGGARCSRRGCGRPPPDRRWRPRLDHHRRRLPSPRRGGRRATASSHRRFAVLPGLRPGGCLAAGGAGPPRGSAPGRGALAGRGLRPVLVSNDLCRGRGRAFFLRERAWEWRKGGAVKST